MDFAAWFEVCRGQFLGFVVAFRAPGDVVGVAEGVDVEDVDVGGCEEEVLNEGCYHVPGIEEHDARDEVEDVGRAHGDDKREEDVVRKEEADGEDLLFELVLYRLDRDEDGGEEEVAVARPSASAKYHEKGEGLTP